MNWRPHTQRPDQAPISCVLAESDEDGYILISGLYTWNGKHFRDEETDRKPRPKAFWWIQESEVLQGLPE